MTRGFSILYTFNPRLQKLLYLFQGKDHNRGIFSNFTNVSSRFFARAIEGKRPFFGKIQANVQKLKRIDHAVG